jgi:hypothetical protein
MCLPNSKILKSYCKCSYSLLAAKPMVHSQSCAPLPPLHILPLFHLRFPSVLFGTVTVCRLQSSASSTLYSLVQSLCVGCSPESVQLYTVWYSYCVLQSWASSTSYCLVQKLRVGCSPEAFQPYTLPKTGLFGKNSYSRYFVNICLVTVKAYMTTWLTKWQWRSTHVTRLLVKYIWVVGTLQVSRFHKQTSIIYWQSV